MIGDRFLTDVVFGNRNGMLTIRPAPFTSKGEPKAVLLVSQCTCFCSRGLCSPLRSCCVWAQRDVMHHSVGRRQDYLHGVYSPELQPRRTALSMTLDTAAAFYAVQARSVEEYCVDRWRRQGVQPPPQPLVSDPTQLSSFLRHPDDW